MRLCLDMEGHPFKTDALLGKFVNHLLNNKTDLQQFTSNTVKLRPSGNTSIWLAYNEKEDAIYGAFSEGTFRGLLEKHGYVTK